MSETNTMTPHLSQKRKHEESMKYSDERPKKSAFYDRRLCLKNVLRDATKPEIMSLVEDFEDVSVYMPENTKKLETKLVFIDFPKPWMAKVALKLINLLGGRITADFACVNENDFSPNLPPLLDLRTKFLEGTFPENGNCAHCVFPLAGFVCKVCFSPYSATFYCNSDHQTRDWARHKFNCKPLPKLIRPEEAEAAIVQANDSRPKKKFSIPFVEHLKKGDSVVIVQVVNERVIYVRPTREDFSQLISAIKASAEISLNMTAKPEVNDTVLALYQEEFCRAQIVDVFEPDEDGNDMRCFLLDYGIFREYKWPNGFKKLMYKYRGLPRQTFKVILNGIKIEKNKKEAQNFLEAIKNRMDECEIVSEEMIQEQKYVVLKIKDEIINERIQKFDEIIDQDEIILFDEAKVAKIPTGNNTKVKVVDVSLISNGYIVCMSYDNLLLLWRKKRDIDNYVRSNTPKEIHEPTKCNELCLIKTIEDRWERAAYQDSKETTCDMVLVDKLTFESIPKENIRKLPSYLATDFFSNLCRIKDFSDEIKVKIEASEVLTVSVELDENDKCFVLTSVQVAN